MGCTFSPSQPNLAEIRREWANECRAKAERERVRREPANPAGFDSKDRMKDSSLDFDDESSPDLADPAEDLMLPITPNDRQAIKALLALPKPRLTRKERARLMGILEYIHDNRNAVISALQRDFVLNCFTLRYEGNLLPGIDYTT